jgi:thymidylate synthase
MNNLDKQYLELLQDILDNGYRKEDRTGTGTISVFGRQIRHKMSEGFPLLTTKKMAWKTMVTELLWFLRGDTNIKFLVDNNCHIWDGDAYKNYLSKVENYANSLSVPDDISEFQVVMDSLNTQIKSSVLSKEEFINKIKTDDEFDKKWGELGPVYGKQWRSWHLNAKVTTDGKYHEEKGIDQIANLINDLKTNSDSRRLMVNAWNVGELDQMTLPPCHYGFQCYVRDGKYLSLMWNQRSVDTLLGLPFNIASYGLLLTILAKEVNMVPDQLIGNLGDTHLYLNHIEQAKEQITREPFELPTLNQFPTYEGSRPSIESYVVGDFTLKDYQSHETIKAPLSN